MLEFGSLLAQSGLFIPVIHFAHKSSWAGLEEDVLLAEQQGFEVSADTRRAERRRREFLATFGTHAASRDLSLRTRIKIWLKGTFDGTFGSQLLASASRLRTSNLITSLIKDWRRLRRVDSLLNEERPEIVVLSIDMPTWDTGIYVRGCHERGIPAVVAFSQTGPLDEAAYVCAQQWHRRTALPLNCLVSKLLPKWAYESHGKRFLMLGPGEILAKELLGTSMPQPWIESSSNADAVLVENEAYLNRGLRAGLVAQNLHVTGYPFHDALHRGMIDRAACRKRVRTAHRLLGDKPIILTSLLPNYAGRDHADADFSSYEEMVRYWIRSLVAYGEYETIVSLHPTQPPSEMAYIEDLGATIACLPIPQMMPACHTYVASLSSTITMAAACGIPVVNYDYAHYRNSHYADASGVIYVDSRHDFETVLEKLLRDPQYHAGVAEMQSRGATQWGLLDGNAGNRILCVLDGL